MFLKLENFQPSGSVKDRGVGHFCHKAAEAGARRFIVSSGSNASLAVAHAGKNLHIPVHAVLPSIALPSVPEYLNAMGATFAWHGDTWADSNAFASAKIKQEGEVYVPSYSHSDVWTGYSTLVDEIAAMGIQPGAVALAMNGGGLLRGVIRGLKRVGWTATPVIAVKLSGTSSIPESELFDMARRDSLASLTHPARIEFVGQGEAFSARERFSEDHSVAIDLVTAALVATCYDNPEAFATYDSVVLIIGGAGSSGPF